MIPDIGLVVSGGRWRRTTTNVVQPVLEALIDGRSKAVLFCCPNSVTQPMMLHIELGILRRGLPPGGPRERIGLE